MTEIEFIDIFAGNLRYTMEESGYSQSDLAFDSGISQGTISRYLQGVMMPSVKSLNNLCCVLNCNIDDLVPFYEMIE